MYKEESASSTNFSIIPHYTQTKVKYIIPDLYHQRNYTPLKHRKYKANQTLINVLQSLYPTYPFQLPLLNTQDLYLQNSRIFSDLDKKQNQEQSTSQSIEEFFKKIYLEKHQSQKQIQNLQAIEMQQRNIDFENTIQRVRSITTQRIDLKIIDNFIKLQIIGVGATSIVYRVIQKKTGTVYALKQISSYKEHKYQIVNQLNAIKNLDFKNIIQIFGYFVENDTFYVLMQYGQKLSQNLSQKQIKQYAKQLFEGLSYIHTKGIIHRDIKFQNLIIANNNLKICDFGLATRIENNKYQYVGTLQCLAPQMASKNSYNQKVDIWAAGILLLQLHLKQKFLDKLSQYQKLQFIINVSLSNKFQFQNIDIKKVDKQLQCFLKALLNKDYMSRISAQQALMNKFFQNQ